MNTTQEPKQRNKFVEEPKEKEYYIKEGNTLSQDNTGKRKSKKTKAWELLGEAFTNGFANRMFEHMNNMEDKEFAATYIQLLEFFKPKQSRVESENKNDNRLIIERKIIE